MGEVRIYRGNIDAYYHQAVQFTEQKVMRAGSRLEVEAALREHEIHRRWLRRQSDPEGVLTNVIDDAEHGLGERVPY